MKEVRSNFNDLVQRTGDLIRGRNDLLTCEHAQDLMSPFIDSMAAPDEVDRLQLHLATCDPCRRQLQAFISIRGFLSRAERPAAPEDMVLNTRVKLSQERNRNYLERLENRVSNILKPIAIPAIAGVSLTMLLFGVLCGALISNTTVMANDRYSDDRALALYKPVRTTNMTMKRFVDSYAKNWGEPLIIETHVADDGKVMEYRIISGPETPEIIRWVRQQLSMAYFTPATMFGKPVDSKIILSFVAVKS